MAVEGGRSFNNSNFAGGSGGGSSYVAGTGIEIDGNTINNTGLVSLDDVPDASLETRGLVNTGSQSFLGSKYFASNLTLGQALVGAGGGKPTVDTDGNLTRPAFNNYIAIMTDNAGFGSFEIANANTIKLVSVMYDDISGFSTPYELPQRIDRSNTTEIRIQIDGYSEMAGTLVNCIIAY